MPRQDAPAIRGADIIAAVKRCGIGTVVSRPDVVTSDSLLWPISRDPELRLVRVCKEDEGVSICAGLAFAGKRALLLIQHTGLLDSVNALRAIAVEYAMPICMIVGLQGMEPDREPPESASPGVRIVEPLLDVMGIDHARLGVRGDEARIGPAFDRAYAQSRAYAFLVTRAPE
jgi:sulfopyruvate decarboxylase TPP-binding subunit